jgi:hypothetical protein
MGTVQQAVGQRNTAVDILPVFNFHVLDVRKLAFRCALKLALSGQRDEDGSLQQQSVYSCLYRA